MCQNGQTHIKILQHLLQDFESVFDHFGTLCIRWLRVVNYNKTLSNKLSLISAIYVIRYEILNYELLKSFWSEASKLLYSDPLSFTTSRS